MPKISLKKRTPSFKQKVYEAVKKIPRGRVMTYKQVAEFAGRPNAYRAVGSILNKNESPQIPCHRIIKSDGRIGGYRYGTKRKASLLEKEDVLIENWRIQF